MLDEYALVIPLASTHCSGLTWDIQCNRNTDIIDTCIIFPQWHISSTFSFVVSFFAIVGLGILYEYLREIQKNVDRQIAASLRNHGIESPIRGATGRQGTTSPEGISEVEDAGLLTGRRTSKKTEG